MALANAVACFVLAYAPGERWTLYALGGPYSRTEAYMEVVNGEVRFYGGHDSDNGQAVG